jgi:hypothetical protein
MSTPEKEDPTETSPAAEEESVEGAENQKPKELTAEEQMALYEKSLKEDDWGHQPC